MKIVYKPIRSFWSEEYNMQMEAMMTENTSNPADEDRSGNSNNDPYKPKGKCKKAVYRSLAIYREIKKISILLQKGESELEKVICNTSNTLKYLTDDPETLKIQEELGTSEKARSMVKDVQNRIEFRFNHLKFYIDFTVVVSEGDDQANIKGSIVYGTSRTLCFSECIFPNRSTDDECKNCQRIKRCDALEDKPLICFSVTQHGMIQSSGELEGEWWIEDKSNLLELHYRALDLIWKQALDWSNENILP